MWDLRKAVYALCIINEPTESSHNGCMHNASVSNARVRGHVWLCACLPKIKTNKETFESPGGSWSYQDYKRKQLVA